MASTDGTSGDDILNGTSSDDTILGNGGRDTISSASGDDTIFGGSGDDLILTGTGNDSVDGGDGSDRVFAGDGTDTLAGGAGDDLLFGEKGADTLYGGRGRDNLYGGSGDDSLDGASGDDFLSGGAGADSISGGAGDDDIEGGAGADTIDAGAGHDTVEGGQGADSIIGGAGQDSIDGGSEDDTITGGSGDDILIGGSGNDSMDGGSGVDTLEGQDGDDILVGGSGIDTLWGGTGADTLYGGSGDDSLQGASGDDYLYGGDGIDTVLGDQGTNVLAGGGGGDRFVVLDGTFDTTITDFSKEDDDRVITVMAEITEWSDLTSRMSQSGLDTVLTFDNGSTLTIQNILPSQLNPGQFMINGAPICLVEGTKVQTPQGWERIERLRAGDLVLTRDHGPQPIRHVAARRYRFLSPKDAMKPIEIGPDSLSPGVPSAPLCVSPQHRILVEDPDTGDEVLVPAAKLTWRKGIRRMRGKQAATYYHLLLDQHEVLMANGAPVESLLLTSYSIKQLRIPAHIAAEFPASRIPARTLLQYDPLKRHKKNLPAVFDGQGTFPLSTETLNVWTP